MRRTSRSVLPGFGLSLGITCTYLSLMVLLPLATVFARTADLSWAEFWGTVTNPRVLASYRVTFGASFVAALVNTVFGLLVAWVLVRYRFPGRRLVDAMVDLPFALPTAVAGIALTTLYAGNGWVGRYLEPLGIKVSYTWIGITVALIFIGLPFVVRTVQPVLDDLDVEVEEAAASLGARRSQTFLRLSGPGDQPRMMPSTSGARVASARFSVPSLKSAGPISSGGDNGSMGCPSRSSFLPSRKATSSKTRGRKMACPKSVLPA